MPRRSSERVIELRVEHQPEHDRRREVRQQAEPVSPRRPPATEKTTADTRLDRILAALGRTGEDEERPATDEGEIDHDPQRVVRMQERPAVRDVADDRHERPDGKVAQRPLRRSARDAADRVRQTEDLQQIADRIRARDCAIEKPLPAGGDGRAEHEKPDHGAPGDHHRRYVDPETKIPRPGLGALGKPQQPHQEHREERDLAAVDRRGKRHGARHHLIAQGRREGRRQEHGRGGEPTPGGRRTPLAATARGRPEERNGRQTGQHQEHIGHPGASRRRPPR